MSMRKQDNVIQSQLNSARQSLAKMEKAWGRDHSKLLPVMQNLCDLLFALDRYEEAEQIAWRMLSVSTKNYGHDHKNVSDSLQSIGEICEVQGLALEAERFYLWALSIRDPHRKYMPGEVKTILARLAHLYRDTEQQFKARVIEQRLEKALTNQAQERYVAAV